MFKSGLILALASLLGFFSNFIFSIFLEKNAYGEVVTLFSLVSILVLVAPLGTNAFFLSHREIYEKSANAIIVLPALISFFIGLGFLVDGLSLLKVAFICLLVVSTLSVQGIMASQIQQDGLQAAIYQSLQPFLKSVAALAVLVSVVVINGKGQTVNTLALGLIICSVFLIPLMLWQLVDLQSGGGFFDLAFFKNFTKAQWISLISFWLSSVLGIAYSLGVIPLVSYFHGYHYAAYLGIYFIFWSGSNILITMLINNHYWPKCCAARSAGEDERGIIVDSLRMSLGVAALTLFGTVLVALFISELIWSEYTGIGGFLVIVSLAISIRAVSAWLGMMILSFDTLITRKMHVQFSMVLLMVASVASIDIASYQILAWLLVILEVGYFLGYFLSSVRVLKNRYFSRS